MKIVEVENGLVLFSALSAGDAFLNEGALCVKTDSGDVLNLETWSVTFFRTDTLVRPVYAEIRVLYTKRRDGE